MKLLSSALVMAIPLSIMAMLPNAAVASSDISVIDDNELLEVHKSPTCGCCTGWVEHMQQHGFKTEVNHPDNLTHIKNEAGIPANARSCHTAISSNDYVFEGHIPAKFVAQFLENPPERAKGLVVPAMPVGSPGMEYNNQFMSYTILQLNQDGSLQPYAVIDTPEQQY